MSLIAELKRRNVIRVAALYLVAGWLVLQVGDVVFPALGVPDWGLRFVLGLLVLGFPIAVIFSWVYEMTPEGLKVALFDEDPPTSEGAGGPNYSNYLHDIYGRVPYVRYEQDLWRHPFACR